jgi:hypothetical protein
LDGGDILGDFGLDELFLDEVFLDNEEDELFLDDEEDELGNLTVVAIEDELFLDDEEDELFLEDEVAIEEDSSGNGIVIVGFGVTIIGELTYPIIFLHRCVSSCRFCPLGHFFKHLLDPGG